MAMEKWVPVINPSLYILETDSGALLPSLCLFFPQDPEQRKSHQLPREHFSQLCKHPVFWCVCFLMTQYVSMIKGSAKGDSKGEKISTNTHTHTHMRTHTRTPPLWAVCQNTCVFENESNIKHLPFFHSAAMRWHAIVFLCIPPLWILIPARQRMGLLKYSLRGAIRYRAGHHSAVKGILLMCCPSYK